MSTSPDAERLLNGQAWREFCDRLQALGDQVLQYDFPNSPRDRAEGLRHILRQLVQGLQSSMEFPHGDPPTFFRMNDDVTNWGGPNVDNTYHRANIRGDRTYRVTGKVGRLHHFILQVSKGDYNFEGNKVFAETSARELAFAPDGSFELLISAEEQPGNWLPLHPEADRLHIRQYFYDWEVEEPAEFRIVEVDNEGRSPEPLSADRMASMLDGSIAWAEHEIAHWKTRVLQSRQDLAHNQLSVPERITGGVQAFLYGRGYFNLAEDEALIIEMEAPQASYWSLQLYNFWMESPDFVNRQCSLNGHQAQVDPDGRIHFVIAHRNPGVANWLDTAGHREGTISFRCEATASALHPTSRVAKLDEVHRHLPETTPRMDEAGMAARIARRQAHMARRFRR